MTNESRDGLGILISIILLLIIGIFFLIKFAIIGLVIIISAICVWIANSNNKKEKKIIINDIMEECFNGSIIKPSKDIDKNQLKKKLGIFDISIYNELFESQIIKRGQDYFAEHKVKNVKSNEQKWNCEVEGTKKYNVSLEFDQEDKNKIVNVQCECPYYLDNNNKNCKHIYALLTRVKCGEDFLLIGEKITDYSNRLTEMIKKENKYIATNSNLLKVSTEDSLKFSEYTEQLQLNLQRLAKTLETNCFYEDILLDEFVNVIKSSYNFNKQFEEFITKGTKKENSASVQNIIGRKQEENGSLANTIMDVIAINEIEKNRNKEKKKNKGNNFWNLDENEMEAVDKDGYDPWNFEEEELEEDDYYFEDDE